MKENKETIFTLPNFEGPLPFLLHLVQKNEVPIIEITINELMHQYGAHFATPALDNGAEFIGITSLLLWIKSKTLLPTNERSVEEELNPSLEVLYKLFEYCQFKELAKNLIDREEEQASFHLRRVVPLQHPEGLSGIESFALEELVSHFKTVLNRHISNKRIIYEEAWKVADKVLVIRDLVQTQTRIVVKSLFQGEKSKLEIIVFFLAILEMIKTGEIALRIEGGIDSKCLLIVRGPCEFKEER